MNDVFFDSFLKQDFCKNKKCDVKVILTIFVIKLVYRWIVGPPLIPVYWKWSNDVFIIAFIKQDFCKSTKCEAIVILMFV